MTTIPSALHEHIDTAFPANPCLVATVLADGWPQVTVRGSVLVFDDTHLAFWERGRGTTTGALKDGDPVLVFFRKPSLRESGLLPVGGIARFYGRVTIHKSGPVRDQIWDKVVPAEKERDPERKGWGVLVAIERAEDLTGKPLG